MDAENDIRARVDKFLEADKTLQGQPLWILDDRPGQLIINRALVEAGEFTGGKLKCIAYPNSRQREWRMVVVFGGECIYRIDYVYEEDGPHVNDFDRPAGYPAVPIQQPHIHSWVGNRHKSTASGLSKKLWYADCLDSKINSIGQGFWWLCDEINISARTEQAPDWPTPNTLL